MREISVEELNLGQIVAIKDARGKYETAICIGELEIDGGIISFYTSKAQKLHIGEEDMGDYRFYLTELSAGQVKALKDIMLLYARKRKENVNKYTESKLKQQILSAFEIKHIDIRKRVYECMRRLDPKSAEYSEILVGKIRVVRSLVVGKTKDFDVSKVQVSKRVPKLRLLEKGIEKFKDESKHSPIFNGCEVREVYQTDRFVVKQDLKIALLSDGETVVAQVESELGYIKNECTDAEIERIVRIVTLK